MDVYFKSNKVLENIAVYYIIYIILTTEFGDFDVDLKI